MHGFGTVSLTWDLLLSFLSIILIDLILAGDNAVVIAMAVRTLPQKQRLKGIALGAGAAGVDGGATGEAIKVQKYIVPGSFLF